MINSISLNKNAYIAKKKLKVETHVMKQFSKYDFCLVHFITKWKFNNWILFIIYCQLKCYFSYSELIIFTDSQTIVENYINLKGSINIKSCQILKSLTLELILDIIVEGKIKTKIEKAKTHNQSKEIIT